MRLAIHWSVTAIATALAVASAHCGKEARITASSVGPRPPASAVAATSPFPAHPPEKGWCPGREEIRGAAQATRSTRLEVDTRTWKPRPYRDDPGSWSSESRGFDGKATRTDDLHATLDDGVLSLIRPARVDVTDSVRRT